MLLLVCKLASKLDETFVAYNKMPGILFCTNLKYIINTAVLTPQYLIIWF